jgi:hypothetical protein
VKDDPDTTANEDGRGGKLAASSTAAFVSSDQTPRIQEAQILTGHILCEIIEQQLLSDEKS